MGLSHQGTKFRICATPQSPGLNQAGFDGLTYIESAGMVTVPSLNVPQNTIRENTVDTGISSVAAGFRNGAETEVRFSFRELTDAFVAAMEDAAASSNYYAVQVELNNSLGTNGTIYSALVFVAGGGGPSGGGGEDFAQRVYNLTPTDQLPLEKAAA